jgi:glycosyltransferase involved in cell wall biosynthesis
MQILVVHNRYKIRSGEDSVFFKEVKLLEENGHQVLTWTVDNRELDASSLLQKIKLAINTTWSWSAYHTMQEKIREHSPEIVHVHNFMPLLSPSIFYACQSMRVPVIQTLHNYRLGCPLSYYSREGKICELCRERSLLESIRLKCYHNSRLETASIAIMLQVHRWLLTWQRAVDGFIVLSDFQHHKMKELGIPEKKMYLKPNFVERAEITTQPYEFGSYYLYVGRLTEEKGIHLLLESYQLSKSKYSLIIVGDGELKDVVISATRDNPMIQYIGTQTPLEVKQWMSNAIALLFPSLWYECLPMTILEAYCCSLPVVSTDVGVMPDMVKSHKTGLIVSPPLPTAMAEAISWVEANAQNWINLKKNLLKEFNQFYFADANYKQMMNIYQTVIKNKS